MMNTEKKERYTYEEFVEDAISMATTLQYLEMKENCNFGFNYEKFIDKADAFLEQ